MLSYSIIRSKQLKQWPPAARQQAGEQLANQPEEREQQQACANQRSYEQAGRVCATEVPGSEQICATKSPATTETSRKRLDVEKQQAHRELAQTEQSYTRHRVRPRPLALDSRGSSYRPSNSSKLMLMATNRRGQTGLDERRQCAIKSSLASANWQDRARSALVLLVGVLVLQLGIVQAQYRPDWPSKTLQQEIFLLNLEDGYFGCQVNESQDFLQLFELSRLCDGQTQCYLGTDEMSNPLKCNTRDKCGSVLNSLGQPESIRCVNGVCLDGLCYCNDGFGGKSCDVPDENECKYRPCDVFAHCTNTMGSYYCSCFPGESRGQISAASLTLPVTTTTNHLDASPGTLTTRACAATTTIGYDGDGMHCQGK